MEIEGACPYFFEMRELIGQRPNHVPVGLGNNDTAVDTSAILRRSPEFTAGGDFGGYVSEEWDIEEQSPQAQAEHENEDETPDNGIKGVLSTKRKVSDITATAPEKAPARKKKQKKDEFVEIAQAEEVTRQKEMDVAKARAEKDIVRAQIKLARIELEREKLRDQRERRQERAVRKQLTATVS